MSGWLAGEDKYACDPYEPYDYERHASERDEGSEYDYPEDEDNSPEAMPDRAWFGRLASNDSGVNRCGVALIGRGST
jgi:hypothetical protein